MTAFYAELRDWAELIGWALVGAALGTVFIVGIGVAAWHAFWLIAVGTV